MPVTAPSLLLAAYLAFTGTITIWNIAAAGRIVRRPETPRIISYTTALAALLLLPAIVVAISATSVTYGRAIQQVGWLWAGVSSLLVIQAAAALRHKLVSRLLGVPILIYNVFLATVAVTRYFNATGIWTPVFANGFSAAYADLLAFVGGESVLWTTGWLLVPLLSPVHASRSRLKRALRNLLIGITAIVTLMLLTLLPRGIDTIASYNAFASATIEPRPTNDFAFGVRILPDLRSVPTGAAISRDTELLDSLDAGAVALFITPEGTTRKTLDSLTETLNRLRTDSTIVIVTLGLPRNAAEALAQSTDAYVEARMRELDHIARTIQPSILIPVHEPYGAAERTLGRLDPAFWEDYLIRAGRVIRAVNPSIQLGLSTLGAHAADSTLYTWAARPSAPVDLLGFNLMPGLDGGYTHAVRLHAAQRWMRNLPSIKPHWIWAAGGFPLAHGEASQQLALRSTLAWATLHPYIRGIVVTDAGDYDAQRGLRAPSGRYRPAFTELRQAIITLHD